MRKNHPQTIIVAAILLLFAVVVVAGDSTNSAAANLKRDLDRLYEIATNQEPKGSTTSWSVTTNSDNQIIFHFHNNTSGSNWITYGGPVPISLPHTFIETNSGMSFLVESDGRHIVASSADEKILWRKDPFADAHLEFYRTENPKIVYISSLSKTMSLINGFVKRWKAEELRILFALILIPRSLGVLIPKLVISLFWVRIKMN
jgi:hypothetical protein